MLILILSLCAFAAPPDGTYVLQDSPATLAATHAAALESGLAQLPWAFRGFAKGRLTPTINNCQRLDFALDATNLTVRCEDDPAFARLRNGTQQSVTGKDGQPYKTKVSVNGDVVSLTFTGESGGQTTTYATGPDGTLKLTKALHSSYFDEPVSWTATYKREGPVRPVSQ